MLRRSGIIGPGGGLLPRGVPGGKFVGQKPTVMDPVFFLGLTKQAKTAPGINRRWFEARIWIDTDAAYKARRPDMVRNGHPICLQICTVFAGNTLWRASESSDGLLQWQ